jgi:hypothetical protein
VKAAPFFRTELRRIRRLAHPPSGPGGTPHAPVGLLDALRLSDDPDACKVLSAYMSVPSSYRRLVKPEAFCQVAEVSPSRVLEVIASVEIRWGTQASEIIAKMMLPSVVRKAVEKAQKPDGFKDRELLFRATGLVPTGR